MNCRIGWLLAITLATAAILPASAQIPSPAHRPDTVGLFKDIDGSFNSVTTPAPFIQVDFYLLALKPTGPSGIHGVEVGMHWTGNILLLSSTPQGSGFNLGQDNDLLIAFPEPLPQAAAVVLVQFEALVMDMDPVYFYLGPPSRSSVDPPAPLYAPGDRDNLKGFVQLGYSSGAAENPVFTINGEITAVESDDLPVAFALRQNSPNPFNPRTTIPLDLPVPGRVRVTVYDVKGRVVRALIDDRMLPAGRRLLVWDGCDDRGHSQSSGVYLCRAECGTWARTIRMTLVH